jgi:hypothetical protein
MVRGMRIGGRNGEQHCCGGDRSRKGGQKLRHSRLHGLAGNPGSMVDRASGALRMQAIPERTRGAELSTTPFFESSANALGQSHVVKPPRKKIASAASVFRFAVCFGIEPCMAKPCCKAWPIQTSPDRTTLRQALSCYTASPSRCNKCADTSRPKQFGI